MSKSLEKGIVGVVVIGLGLGAIEYLRTLDLAKLDHVVVLVFLVFFVLVVATVVKENR